MTVVAASGSNPPTLSQSLALAMLTRPGCPACHCVRDAAEAYLAWLDVEGRASSALMRWLIRFLITRYPAAGEILDGSVLIGHPAG